jgi:excisionase family DNA binding protein
MPSKAIFKAAEPAVLTLREAAALLGLYPNTVRSHVTRGLLPGVKVGRDWHFLESDLAAWIRSPYPDAARVQLGALEKEAIWHSIDVQESTTSSSRARTDTSSDALPERWTAARRRNITTG